MCMSPVAVYITSLSAEVAWSKTASMHPTS